MDIMLWIRAHLLPAYCITGFITVSGLIGVVTNTFLENYYHQMHELTLNLLPKWLRQFRLYVLWSARIELLPLLVDSALALFHLCDLAILLRMGRIRYHLGGHRGDHPSQFLRCLLQDAPKRGNT